MRRIAVVTSCGMCPYVVDDLDMCWHPDVPKSIDLGNVIANKSAIADFCPLPKDESSTASVALSIEKAAKNMQVVATALEVCDMRVKNTDRLLSIILDLCEKIKKRDREISKLKKWREDWLQEISRLKIDVQQEKDTNG